MDEVLAVCSGVAREEVTWQLFLFAHTARYVRVNNACEAIVGGWNVRPTTGWVCSCANIWSDDELACLSCDTPQPAHV